MADDATGQITTTSLDVAEKFGKEHRAVLLAIRSVKASPEFIAHNFMRYAYRPEGGRGGARTAYHLTRDGFCFLVMGFTGKKAAAWKERYIAAFNAMEAELRKRQVAGMFRGKNLSGYIARRGATFPPGGGRGVPACTPQRSSLQVPLA